VSDSRAKIWFALFVLVVFCAGAAAGVFIERRFDGPQRSWRGGPPSGGGPGSGRGGPPPEVLLRRLDDDLDLDATQREAVARILRESRDRIEGLQRDVRQQFDREQQNLREEIRKVLRPEQQQRFEETFGRGMRGRGRR
jgi:hypothetical protein